MAIIGHGDIAKVLQKAMRPADDKYIFFASGVSNSQETREEEYKREENLLMGQEHLCHIVYFSSLAIFYSDTRYTKHKLKMEKLIKSFFKTYTIIRLGNIDWGINPHTLINFIRNKTKSNESFEIQDVYRYIVGEQEFLHWVDMIPEWSCEMNIPGTMMKVTDIVKQYGHA
jgi:hypothetical protein